MALKTITWRDHNWTRAVDFIKLNVLRTYLGNSPAARKHGENFTRKFAHYVTKYDHLVELYQTYDGGHEGWNSEHGKWCLLAFLAALVRFNLEDRKALNVRAEEILKDPCQQTVLLDSFVGAIRDYCVQRGRGLCCTLPKPPKTKIAYHLEKARRRENPDPEKIARALARTAKFFVRRTGARTTSDREYKGALHDLLTGEFFTAFRREYVAIVHAFGLVLPECLRCKVLRNRWAVFFAGNPSLYVREPKKLLNLVPQNLSDMVEKKLRAYACLQDNLKELPEKQEISRVENPEDGADQENEEVKKGGDPIKNYAQSVSGKRNRRKQRFGKNGELHAEYEVASAIAQKMLKTRVTSEGCSMGELESSSPQVVGAQKCVECEGDLVENSNNFLTCIRCGAQQESYGEGTLMPTRLQSDNAATSSSIMGGCYDHLARDLYLNKGTVYNRELSHALHFTKQERSGRYAAKSTQDALSINSSIAQRDLERISHLLPRKVLAFANKFALALKTLSKKEMEEQNKNENKEEPEDERAGEEEKACWSQLYPGTTIVPELAFLLYSTKSPEEPTLHLLWSTFFGHYAQEKTTQVHARKENLKNRDRRKVDLYGGDLKHRGLMRVDLYGGIKLVRKIALVAKLYDVAKAQKSIPAYSSPQGTRIAQGADRAVNAYIRQALKYYGTRSERRRVKRTGKKAPERLVLYYLSFINRIGFRQSAVEDGVVSKLRDQLLKFSRFVPFHKYYHGPAIRYEILRGLKPFAETRKRALKCDAYALTMGISAKKTRNDNLELLDKLISLFGKSEGPRCSCHPSPVRFSEKRERSRKAIQKSKAGVVRPHLQKGFVVRYHHERGLDVFEAPPEGKKWKLNSFRNPIRKTNRKEKNAYGGDRDWLATQVAYKSDGKKRFVPSSRGNVFRCPACKSFSVNPERSAEKRGGPGDLGDVKKLIETVVNREEAFENCVSILNRDYAKVANDPPDEAILPPYFLPTNVSEQVRELPDKVVEAREARKILKRAPAFKADPTPAQMERENARRLLLKGRNLRNARHIEEVLYNFARFLQYLRRNYLFVDGIARGLRSLTVARQQRLAMEKITNSQVYGNLQIYFDNSLESISLSQCRKSQKSLFGQSESSQLKFALLFSKSPGEVNAEKILQAKEALDCAQKTVGACTNFFVDSLYYFAAKTDKASNIARKSRAYSSFETIGTKMREQYAALFYDGLDAVDLESLIYQGFEDRGLSEKKIEAFSALGLSFVITMKQIVKLFWENSDKNAKTVRKQVKRLYNYRQTKSHEVDKGQFFLYTALEILSHLDGKSKKSNNSKRREEETRLNESIEEPFVGASPKRPKNFHRPKSEGQSSADVANLRAAHPTRRPEKVTLLTQRQLKKVMGRLLRAALFSPAQATKRSRKLLTLYAVSALRAGRSRNSG